MKLQKNFFTSLKDGSSCGGESQIFTISGLEEVKDVLHELIGVVVNEAPVVHARVNLVRLHGAFHLIFCLLCRCNGAYGVILAKEEAKWSLVELAQVVQVCLRLSNDRRPIVVRVALEAIFLGILGVVIEGLD